jgi:hypothetical protein
MPVQFILVVSFTAEFESGLKKLVSRETSKKLFIGIVNPKVCIRNEKGIIHGTEQFIIRVE